VNSTPPKDLCITCGREVADEVYGGRCESGHITVHQEKCHGCDCIIGLIIDDDHCGTSLLFCPACMDSFRRKSGTPHSQREINIGSKVVAAPRC
jgi:hypothetical protein